MGRVILKDRVTIYDIFAIFTSIIGILLINDPFGWYKEEDDSKEEDDNKDYNYLLGTLFLISGILLGGLAPIIMRYMRDIHYSISPFWFASGCCILSPIAYVADKHYDSDIKDAPSTVYDW